MNYFQSKDEAAKRASSIQSNSSAYIRTTPSSSKAVERTPRTSSVSSSSKSIAKRRLTSINDQSKEWELHVQIAASNLLYMCCQEINLSIEDGLRSASKNLKRSDKAKDSDAEIPNPIEFILKRILIECRQKCSSNVLEKAAGKAVNKATFDPTSEIMEHYILFPDIAIADSDLEDEYQEAATYIIKRIFDVYRDKIYACCFAQFPDAMEKEQNLISAIERMANEISLGCREVYIDSKKLMKKLLKGARHTASPLVIKDDRASLSDGDESRRSFHSIESKRGSPYAEASEANIKKADTTAQTESIIIDDSDEEDLYDLNILQATDGIRGGIDNDSRVSSHEEKVLTQNQKGMSGLVRGSFAVDSSAKASPDPFPISVEVTPNPSTRSSSLQTVERTKQVVNWTGLRKADHSRVDQDEEEVEETEASEQEHDELFSEDDDRAADTDYVPVLSKKRRRALEKQNGTMKRQMRTVPHYDFGKVIKNSEYLDFDEIMDRAFSIFIENMEDSYPTITELCRNRDRNSILKEIKKGILTGAEKIIEAFANGLEMSIDDMQILSRSIPRGGVPMVLIAVANWDLDTVEGPEKEYYEFGQDNIHCAYVFVGTSPQKRLYKLKEKFLPENVHATPKGKCDDGTRLAQVALWRSPEDDSPWFQQDFFTPKEEEKDLKSNKDVRNALLIVAKNLFLISCWTLHTNPKYNMQTRQAFPRAKPVVGMNDVATLPYQFYNQATPNSSKKSKLTLD